MMNLVTAGMVFGMVGEVAVTSVGGAQAKPTAKFLKAVAQVESGGNDWLVGDKHLRQKAYGRYQIRQPVCDDYNRAHGTNTRACDLRGPAKRALAEKICRWYLANTRPKYPKRVGAVMTAEERFARTWNGGPNGVRKPITKKYWHKVERVLEKRK